MLGNQYAQRASFLMHIAKTAASVQTTGRMDTEVIEDKRPSHYVEPWETTVLNHLDYYSQL